MATSTALLVVKIITDATAAEKGLGNAESRVGRLSGALNKAAIPAAAAVVAIGAFGKAAVDSASRTQQAMGAVDSVFGSSAGTIKKWSDQAATSVGLAKSEYGELATVIGAQLKNMGLPMDQVVGKTNDLIGLGADLAATFGGTTAEAVSAVSSALRGETDPIERYGVAIKQADIAARMAADGTDKLTGKAAKQAKTQALLAMMTEQTADAQGQFARESDSAAGAAQIQAAQFEDMKSALGTALLPLVSKFSAVLGKMAVFVSKNSTAFQILVGVVGALALVILVAAGALKVYNIVTGIMAIVSANAWMAALGPILLVIAAVALVVVAIVILWKKSETFRRVVKAVWSAVQAGARVAAQVIKAVWNVVFKALSLYVKAYVMVFKAAFVVVRAVVQAVVAVVKAVWRAAWSAVSGYVRGFATTLRAVFGGVRDAVASVVDWIKSKFSALWDNLKGAARSVGDALSAPFDAVKGAVQGAIDLVQRLIDALGRIKVPHISLPKIPGVNLSASAPGVATPEGPVAMGLGAVPMASRTGSSGPTIVVNGALDPEAVARQIDRIMRGHGRRVGLAT